MVSALGLGLLSPCLSSLRSIKGVLENFQESLMKWFFFGGGGGSCPCNRLASYPGGSIANPGYFMLRTQTFLPSNMITSKLRSHVSRTNNF